MLREKIKEVLKEGKAVELSSEEVNKMQEEYSKNVKGQLQNIKKDQLLEKSSGFRFVSG